MKRNITIVIDPSKEDSSHVHINNLNSIVNHSCDSITIDILEYLKESDHQVIIRILLEKLRQSGRLSIIISNAKSIAQQYIKSAISNDSFLNFFANKQSLISVESLYTFMDFALFDMIDLDITNTFITIVFERKEL
jgi:predicted SAM-dependent methyltransferase